MILVVKRAGLLLVLMVLIVSFLILNLGNYTPASTGISHTVVIDAGHGSPDGGSTGINSGVYEKDLTLAVSLYLKEELNNLGFNVIMTRENENGVYKNSDESLREQKRKDLSARLLVAESSRADLMISVHMNHFSDSKYCGPQIFYAKDIPGSDKLAATLRESIIKIIGEHCTRETKPNNELFLLKKAKIPTVIAECGFLSNPAEEKLLSSPEYQKQLARALADGIVKFFE